ncbi:hypothetical protein FGO68_gene11755 [Halteria grandinella]|uniref:C2 NT-type domain-containing protein n=1 Tax=Halteria grandinella TaxID=5974 RepID=A0A8J8T231_HALGN|nr:hypothetical protein FGO68_gene11755 [Halteria grandinella]
MAKYFQRIGTEKKDFIITVKLISFQADLQTKSYFSIQWKRGPQTEDSPVFELNPISGNTTIINEQFSRQSQLYRDTKSGRFLKKTCNFKLKKWESASSRVIDEVEIDMAPFINSGTSNITRIKFPGGSGSSDTGLNAVLEVDIKLQEGLLAGNSPGQEDEEQEEGGRMESFVSPQILEGEVNRLNLQIAEYQRQVSESRQAQQKLEDELRRKDKQLDKIIKQHQLELSETEQSKVIQQLRDKLTQQEQEISSLQSANAQQFIELSAHSDEIDTLKRKLLERDAVLDVSHFSHVNSQANLSHAHINHQIQLQDSREEVAHERMLKLKELDELNHTREQVEKLTSEVTEHRRNAQIPVEEPAQQKNILQVKMESALMKQIKELEVKLDAANHAALTGKRFDDFDHFAY